jgi:hypothetical protein
MLICWHAQMLNNNIIVPLVQCISTDRSVLSDMIPSVEMVWTCPTEAS